MIDDLFLILGAIVASIGAAIAWTFVAIYRKPPFIWETYESGRHLMRFTAGIAVILTWTAGVLVAQVIWGRPDWLLHLIAAGRIAIFGWAAWMLWSRLQILRTARRRATLEGRRTSEPH
jgi:hypothetical protein